jgi:D-glycero-D-manno-heptose 1,7-bisphosphate phosphatase
VADGNCVDSDVSQSLRATRSELLTHRARPAAFLDRDGVLNVDRTYTHKLDDLVMIPSAPAAVRLLNEVGYYVFVVTNQSGVARGYYPETAVDRFNMNMQDILMSEGAHIDAFYYCPHHPDGKVKELAIQCRCRKPRPGMLEQAAREWPIDLSRSFLIGDKDHDLAAAAAFHIHGVKFDAQAGSLVDLVRRELALRSA